MRGADFAWGVPRGREREFARALRRAGFRFVVRYLSTDPSKNLTRAEVLAYKAEGIDIVTVWETTADSTLGGAAAGRAAAQAAKAQLAQLGAPAHAPVYFAVDFDVTAEQMVTVDAYLDATAFVLTEAENGVYGGYAAVTKAQHVRYEWQTLGWSAGKWFAHDALEQTGVGDGVTDGVQWDLDESKVADFGQWEWEIVHRVPPKPPKPKRHVVKKTVRKGKKVVKQEPVMTAASANSLVASAAVWWAHHLGLHLTVTQQHAILTIVTALAGMAAAAVTRPWRVTAFFTALGTAATAAMAFGLKLPPQYIAAEFPVITLLLGALLRMHVSPAFAADAEAVVAAVAPATPAAPAVPAKVPPVA